MNPSFFLSLHFLWIILAVSNLVVQTGHFYNEQNHRFFIAKKLTTPLLLFLALLIVILKVKSFPLIPCAILAAMGIGELAVEGSNLVQPTKENSNDDQKASIWVTLAGVLFLLVNIFIGVSLIRLGDLGSVVFICLLISLLSILLIFSQVFRIFEPNPEVKTQMMIYSVGIIILFTGALVDMTRGISTLGVAATILTISDSLVLIRMGCGFDKNSKSGFNILLGFLVIILLLYYCYMGVLVHIGSPFSY
jgi:hypothetical protein